MAGNSDQRPLSWHCVPKWGAVGRAISACAVTLIAASVLLSTRTVAGEPGLQADPAPREVFGKVYQCRPGPWGSLEYYSMHFEMPDYLVNHFPRPESLPHWSFAGGTEASLRTLFDGAGLRRPFQDVMLDPGRRVSREGVLTVFPPVPDLISMTSQQRSIIYRELAKCTFNPYHVTPICIANGDPDAWFSRSGMRPELGALCKKMSYMRGQVLCFSDLAVVFGMVGSEGEARDVFRAMSRTQALVLRLNLKGSADPAEVMRYWSGDHRNKEIEPMLAGAAETEGMERLDCIHLLPTLVRRCLYRYPSEDLSVAGLLPDCHWTALNFFNSTPINYGFDPRYFEKSLAHDYVAVAPPYRFGDLLVLTTPEGEAVHSCNYIADDIVYTKNGETLAAPWLLMKMADVKRFYGADQPVSLRGYRLTAQSEPPKY